LTPRSGSNPNRTNIWCVRAQTGGIFKHSLCHKTCLTFRLTLKAREPCSSHYMAVASLVRNRLQKLCLYLFSFNSTWKA
jgi:hypothetical protein